MSAEVNPCTPDILDFHPLPDHVSFTKKRSF